MSILEIAYVGCVLVALYGYWTQIRAILRPKALLRSVSLKTYATWAVTTGVTTLYSIFENGDFFFIFASVANFVCCSFIATIIIIRRKKLGMKIILSEKASLDTLTDEKTEIVS